MTVQSRRSLQRISLDLWMVRPEAEVQSVRGAVSRATTEGVARSCTARPTRAAARS